jgi:hypothetical protein
MSQTRRAAWQSLVSRAFLIATPLALAVPGAWAQAAPATTPPAASGDAEIHGFHIIGFTELRHNARGRLTIKNGALHFVASTGKKEADIPLSSVENVFTGEEVTQAGGKPVMVGKMAVPYGGGRVLSLLLRSKVDVLTVAYRDENNGLHGVIFSLAKGQAPVVQERLAAAGAHVSAPAAAAATEPAATPAAAAAPASADKKPVKLPAGPIQVERVEVGDVPLPAEFRLAIYEYVVENLKKAGTFPKVYRSGDRDAEGVANLMKAHTLVEKYQAGSETKRAVTTVGGFTKVDVDETVTSKDGQVLLQRKLEGRVRFYGDNLHVTNDLAARIAKLLKASI